MGRGGSFWDSQAFSNNLAILNTSDFNNRKSILHLTSLSFWTKELVFGGQCVCEKNDLFEHKKWILLETKLFIFKFQFRFLILLQLQFRSWGKTQELKDGGHRDRILLKILLSSIQCLLSQNKGVRGTRQIAQKILEHAVSYWYWEKAGPLGLEKGWCLGCGVLVKCKRQKNNIWLRIVHEESMNRANP